MTLPFAHQGAGTKKPDPGDPPRETVCRIRKGDFHLKTYQNHIQPDYDNRVRLESKHHLCYSKKKLKQLHPDGNYRIVGETRSLKRDKKNPSAGPRPTKKGAALRAMLQGLTGTGIVDVGTSSRLFFKKAGYLCVGEGEYVCLLTSRVPFLSVLFSAVLLAGLSTGMILVLNGPLAVPPNYPLPPVDENSRPLEGDDSDKIVTDGGAASLIYTLDAEVNLSKGTIDIYFLNPNASTRDITLRLILLVGDEEYTIGASGRILPGRGLLTLSLNSEEVELSPTDDTMAYAGRYELAYYHPVTGERSLVETKIENVIIRVTE